MALIAAFSQLGGEQRRQRVIVVEPICPGKQRRMRLMLDDVARQGFTVRDVGRIAQDEIEHLGQSGRPITLHQFHTLLDSEAACIGRGIG